jgi:tetratricopeptide (TPR) repeat protein
MSLALAAALIGVISAQAAQGRSFADIVATYRSGQYDRAVAEVTARTDGDAAFATNIDRWLTAVRTAKAEAPLQALSEQQLQAALLLDTEVVFSLVDGVLTGAPHASKRAVSVALNRLRRVHDVLASIDRRSQFLRMWYLLWGAYLQSRNATDVLPDTDLVTVAVKAFSDDSEILLMAGTAKEMTWWMALDNPQRREDGKAGTHEGALRQARELFQKSVATGIGSLGESHLRLGRTLIALEDYEGAAAELEPLRGLQGNAPVAYLANLFLGDLYERRGDLTSASAAYDAALRLVPSGQSAQIAAAHVAHQTNARKQATELIQRALSQSSDQVDPWWWYVRGQGWQLMPRLNAARRAVTQ